MHYKPQTHIVFPNTVRYLWGGRMPGTKFKALDILVMHFVTELHPCPVLSIIFLKIANENKSLLQILVLTVCVPFCLSWLP